MNKHEVTSLRRAAILATLLGSLLAFSPAAAAPETARVEDLRCEYRTAPLGIDTAEPRLSWVVRSDQRGWRQTGYQVLVASSQEKLEQDIGDLWDSRRTVSDQSILVAYEGRPLKSSTGCWWKVRVWDKDGKPSEWSEPSKWTMGLLKPDDWTAQWISASAAPVSHDELTVKKATYRTLDGHVSVDVTMIMQKEVTKKTPFVVHFKTLGGDPAPGVVKELVVEYVRNGKPGTARANDFETIGFFSTPGKPAPLFRREFDLSAAPDSALVTVHSPGYFELYLNGTKVGKDVLTPAVSNLEHQSFTVTYDVSGHLRPGKNCIGVWLGEGWANDIAVRAQLDAVVAGEPITIGTDTSWKTRKSGLYRIGGRKWNDFGGERLDAREIVSDWSLPGLDTHSWTSAISAKAPRGAIRAQPCPLNRVGKEIPAVAVTSLGGGRYEIDFGTALTGWLRLKMPTLQSGAIVRMTFADVRRGKRLSAFQPGQRVHLGRKSR